MKKSAAKTVGSEQVRWVLLSGIGLAAGLVIGLVVAAPIEGLVGMMLVTPIMLAIAGSILGTSQSLAMWRLDRRQVLWIGATGAGFAVGMTIGIVAVEAIGRAITGEQMRLVALSPAARSLGLALIGLLTGLAVGLAQGLVLRESRMARRWVLLSAVGFGVGLPGGGLVADAAVGGLASLPGIAIFLVAAGLITGAVTATGAVRATAALDAASS